MTTVQLYALCAPVLLGVVGLLLGWQGVASARRMKAKARDRDTSTQNVMSSQYIGSEIQPSARETKPPMPSETSAPALERLAS